MKTNYRHQKKLKEQARLTRQAEKLQRRLAVPGQPEPATVADSGANIDSTAPAAKPGA